MTDASQHTKKSSKRFGVPGIASNIPRNKSALVMGICTTFTCFQTLPPRKHSTIETSPKIYLKRDSSKLNFHVQNVHVVAIGEHSVFCCFD